MTQLVLRNWLRRTWPPPVPYTRWVLTPEQVAVVRAEFPGRKGVSAPARDHAADVSSATTSARPRPSAWSCFSRVDALEPAVRYRDVLGVKYSYDATVPNHKAVSVGDLVVIRDEVSIYGHAFVDEVVTELGSKTMTLCPQCKRSGPDRRTTMSPTYRCPDCGNQFDDPEFEDRELAVFEAIYAPTWTELPTPLPRRLLEGVFTGGDRQNAVRRLDWSAAVALLGDHTSVDGLADLRSDGDHASGRIAVTPDGGLVPSRGVRRVGQQGFKAALLERFGPCCAVTGPQPVTVLDAAHLYRFADTPVHHLDGGLLLRADIHRLFDAFLLTIDTTTWTVHLAPELHGYTELVAEVHEKPLRIEEATRPCADLLDDHRDEAERRAETASDR